VIVVSVRGVMAFRSIKTTERDEVYESGNPFGVTFEKSDGGVISIRMTSTDWSQTASIDAPIGTISSMIGSTLVNVDVVMYACEMQVVFHTDRGSFIFTLRSTNSREYVIELPGGARIFGTCPTKSL
jgi:hypothetical protein